MPAKPKLPPEERKVTACLYLRETQLEALRDLAARRGRSLAETAREVVQDGLDVAE